MTGVLSLAFAALLIMSGGRTAPPEPPTETSLADGQGISMIGALSEPGYPCSVADFAAAVARTVDPDCVDRTP